MCQKSLSVQKQYEEFSVQVSGNRETAAPALGRANSSTFREQRVKAPYFAKFMSQRFSSSFLTIICVSILSVNSPEFTSQKVCAEVPKPFVMSQGALIPH